MNQEHLQCSFETVGRVGTGGLCSNQQLAPKLGASHSKCSSANSVRCDARGHRGHYYTVNIAQLHQYNKHRPASEALSFSVVEDQAAAPIVSAHLRLRYVVSTSTVTATSSCRRHLSAYEDLPSVCRHICKHHDKGASVST